jgi:hypothetical protein
MIEEPMGWTIITGINCCLVQFISQQQIGDITIEPLEWKQHILSKVDTKTALASGLSCAQTATKWVSKTGTRKKETFMSKKGFPARLLQVHSMA